MMKQFLISLMMLLTVAPAWSADTFRNPVLWSDVPDPDVIRVGNDFYMVTTTMHLMPGAPIMKSKDLVNWKTVGYLFPRLTDSPKYNMVDGTVYGRGQWATSLKYHHGKFYALFAPNDSPGGETYIMCAEKAEGPWHLVSRLPHFHDATLFFDEDDRVYVIYGTGEMVELEKDLKSVKQGSHVKLFERDADEKGLLEGSRMVKYQGRYYLLMISWPPGKVRREVCYRADKIAGPYEKKVILDTFFAGFQGVGQGTIIDTQDGRWFGMMFQDRGGVGRVMTLEPCRWVDGWPMLGDEQGNVPEVMPIPIPGHPEERIVSSDEFDTATLGIDWQWNHNPVDSAWSLTERKGWLRLRTSRMAEHLFLAPNTISQRTEGPACEAVVKMDVTHMVDGDVAGLSVLQGDAALLSVEKVGTKLYIVASTQSVELEDRSHRVTNVVRKDLLRKQIKGTEVYFKVSADFRLGQDLAQMYYSVDGERWIRAVTDFKMRFDYRRFFMGSRFAIVNFATRSPGGYVDIDYFRYVRKEAE